MVGFSVSMNIVLFGTQSCFFLRKSLNFINEIIAKISTENYDIQILLGIFLESQDSILE